MDRKTLEATYEGSILERLDAIANEYSEFAHVSVEDSDVSEMVDSDNGLVYFSFDSGDYIRAKVEKGEIVELLLYKNDKVEKDLLYKGDLCEDEVMEDGCLCY